MKKEKMYLKIIILYEVYTYQKLNKIAMYPITFLCTEKYWRNPELDSWLVTPVTLSKKLRTSNVRIKGTSGYAYVFKKM